MRGSAHFPASRRVCMGSENGDGIRRPGAGPGRGGAITPDVPDIGGMVAGCHNLPQPHPGNRSP
ncbi:hypothetical protein GCM10023096_70100 [Nonomuraea ferruginea]